MLAVKRFTAAWCGPCKQLAPVFGQIKNEFPQVFFNTIDVDTSPEDVTKYSVTSVPTIIIEKDGQVVNRFVGLNPANTYTDAIKSLI